MATSEATVARKNFLRNLRGANFKRGSILFSETPDSGIINDYYSAIICYEVKHYYISVLKGCLI